MLDDPAEPRRSSGQFLDAIEREDLELYGVGELEARIAALESEIVRTRQQLEKKRAGRDAANALFGRMD